MAETAENAKTKKKQINLLFYIGIFFVLYLINCTAVYFVLKQKYDAKKAHLQAMVDSVKYVRLASMEADSLVQLALIDTIQVEITDTTKAAPDTALLTEVGAAEAVKDTAAAEEYGKRVRKLVKIVDKMKPQKTATVMARLEDEFVVQMLLRMKERNAAKVLSEMPPARAARLSKLMTEKIDS